MCTEADTGGQVRVASSPAWLSHASGDSVSIPSCASYTLLQAGVSTGVGTRSGRALHLWPA